MSDLLVYVNESVSCSVIIENFDISLKTFRHDTLDEQVSDVLPPLYKFTRLLNNQRIVIGVKQEVAIKLSQCVLKEEANFAVYLLREEVVNLKANEPDLNHVQAKSRDGDQDQVPPQKKTKISHQPTLFDMCRPSTATPRPSSTPFSAARAQNVKIFKEQEINESTGMKKLYRQFWNDKAEELCRSNALKTFKPGEIQGAINVAWSLKKTDILKDQIEEVNKEIASKCSTDVLKKFQMTKKTAEKNTERVDAAVSALRTTQENLTKARQEFLDSTNKSERKLASARVDKIEKDLDAQKAELRRAQDALRKATEARKNFLKVESQPSKSDSDESIS